MPLRPSTSPLPTAPRLPPLPRLRVRRANQPDANPCTGIMTSMLGCWASSGYTAAGCVMLEQALRTCMDAKRPKNLKQNTINYHLGRLYPKISGPKRRK